MAAEPSPTATISPATDSVAPPRVPLPRAAQGLGFLISRHAMMRWWHRRLGDAFVLDLPIFGDCVVISDPAHAKQLFTAGDKVHNVSPNLGRVLGDGSVFSLEGTDHRRRRKLLTPPLHGKRIKTYESIVEEETLAEIATWPQRRRFRSLEPMMHITLNIILRAVFGAAGKDLDDLRRIIPPLVAAGSLSATVPPLPRPLRRVDPNHRLRVHRQEYQRAVGGLITQARQDPDLDDRDDILGLLVSSRYDDGSPMSDSDIADELITLLAAGHETTATTLAWAFERVARNPQVLTDLVDEVDRGGSDFRHAVIHEVQRSRPVIDFAGRSVVAETLDLGPWRIPRGHNVLVAISLLHDDSRQFAHPELFDPGRFEGTTPPAAWLPFGGGTRRCIGAAFATMEMDVVLRTVLRELTLEPTTERPEAWHSRGVAYAPRRGGLIRVHRR